MADCTDREHPESADVLVVPKDKLYQMQSLANVGAVSSSVAHEFNNILTTILNQAKLGTMTSDVAVRDRSFDRILDAARRAAKITTGVLAMSRQRSPRMQTTQVQPLVEEVLAVVEKDLAKHRITLERHFEDVPAVTMVPSQIEQVLLNLVINGRQSMQPGGTLKVSVRRSDDAPMVEIGVADSGSGIAPAKLARIFEPFFTTKDGPDDTGQGGSGLGLSICRDIIEHHQGRIRVESLVGRGTKFVIKLPLPAERTQAA